jgi:tetratricopeptide (TPR) repeat protein
LNIKENKVYAYIENYLKCVKILQRVLLDTNLCLASSYYTIGLLYSRNQEYEKATEYFHKSLNIRKRVQPSNYRDLTINYFALGKMYDYSNAGIKADKYYERCLKIEEFIMSIVNRDSIPKEIDNSNSNCLKLKAKNIYKICRSPEGQLEPEIKNILSFDNNESMKKVSKMVEKINRSKEVQEEIIAQLKLNTTTS